MVIIKDQMIVTNKILALLVLHRIVFGEKILNFDLFTKFNELVARQSL